MWPVACRGLGARRRRGRGGGGGRALAAAAVSELAAVAAAGDPARPRQTPTIMTARDAQKIISLEEGWCNNIKPNAINVLEDHLNRVSKCRAGVLKFIGGFSCAALFVGPRWQASREPHSSNMTTVHLCVFMIYLSRVSLCVSGLTCTAPRHHTPFEERVGESSPAHEQLVDGVDGGI